MNKQRQPQASDWLLLFALAMMWGCSFLFIKKALVVFSPLQLALWRMTISSIVSIPIGIIFWKHINWSKWKPLLLVTFLGSAIPNLLFSIAQTKVSSGVAGTLNSLTPIFALVSGVIFFNIPFKFNKLLGILLGMAGAAFLIWQHSHANAQTTTYPLYALLCVAATLCYGVNANIVNTYLRDQHPMAISSASFMLASVFFFPALWWSGGVEALQTKPGAWGAIGYISFLGLVGTILAGGLYFWLIQRTNTIFATSVTYLLPVVALFLGFLDGEAIYFWDILGMVAILSGLYLARK